MHVLYRAYTEEEVDELGFFKAKVVLDKYDDEIDGEKRNRFTIGARGKVDTTWEQQKEQMKKVSVQFHENFHALCTPKKEVPVENM